MFCPQWLAILKKCKKKPFKIMNSAGGYFERKFSDLQSSDPVDIRTMSIYVMNAV